ncbi:MAG: phosphate ABC transporter permease subunit PstC [Actinomycetales bacterium]|nr:phosphate ABC transporter permease subunit PstC [Actinomycetales bacterium]
MNAAERGRSGRTADRIFSGFATGSGALVVVVIGLIALFLLIQAVPSLMANQANFFTSSDFSTGNVEELSFGIRDLLIVTVLSSALALVLAVPVAIGIALFLTQYAPQRLAHGLSIIVDLLAAVPSIVFGLWGTLVLAPAIVPFELWLNGTLGWIPFFARGNVSIEGGGTIFTAGVVLAIMILPIITAVTREVYRQTPRAHMEGALALGATHWEVVRMTVLPFGRSGTIAASMLGLGRALGETIAVLIILRTSATPSMFSLFDGGYTFASKIASAAAEFSQPLSTGAYIAAGFVLFVLTFIVNGIARVVASPGEGGKINWRNALRRHR